MGTKGIQISHWLAGWIEGNSNKKIFWQNPDRILTHAVLGMLPKNKLRHDIMKRLKVFRDEFHPYTTQLALYAPPGPPINFGRQWVRATPDPTRHKGWFLGVEEKSGGLEFSAEKGKGRKRFKPRRQPMLNPEEQRRKKLKSDYLKFPWDIPGQKIEDNPKLMNLFTKTDMTDPEVQKKVQGWQWPPPNPENLPVGTRSSRPKRDPPPSYAAIFGPYLNKTASTEATPTSEKKAEAKPADAKPADQKKDAKAEQKDAKPVAPPKK